MQCYCFSLTDEWSEIQREQVVGHPEPLSQEMVELRRQLRSSSVQTQHSFYFPRDCRLPYVSTRGGLCFKCHQVA